MKKLVPLVAALTLISGAAWVGSLSEEQKEAQGSQANSLNELLKSELASLETYRQAQAAFQQLNTIYQDHQDAVSQLKTQVREAGGEVAEGSGAWGTWAKVVMGSAKLLGDETAKGRGGERRRGLSRVPEREISHLKLRA